MLAEGHLTRIRFAEMLRSIALLHLWNPPELHEKTCPVAYRESRPLPAQEDLQSALKEDAR
jgi:hypothetical protein